MPSEESRPPALELPYELSSQIFIYCLPLHLRVRPTRKRAPLQLAQICSQWRAVALSTPKLWSSIYLEFPAGGPYDGIPMLLGIPGAEAVQDHTCDLLKLWLARAADYPLSITLMCAGKHIRLPEELLDIIAHHTAHWARVEFKFAKADFLDFNRISGPFPALRTLGTFITDDHGGFPVVNALSDAPGLRVLNGLDELSRLTVGPDFESLPTSVTTLQTVEISRNSPLEDFLRILNHFPHLLHLAIRCWDTVRRPRAIPRVVPSLQSLIIHGTTTFLDLIDLPTLEHLDMSLYWHQDVLPLKGFLSRSAGNLNHLTLRLMYAPGGELIPSFAAAPSLTSLELLLPDIGARTISTRYDFLLSKGILPHLQRLIITETLRIGTYVPFLAVLRDLRALVHAELQMWPRHKHVWHRLPPPGPDLVTEFEELSAQGLNIRVVTPNYAWPWDIRDEDAIGDLDSSVLIPTNSDYDIFESKTTPYNFAPFYFPDDLTTCLSAVPSLTTLEFFLLHGGGETQSGAFDLLLQRADLLPHLRTLIITAFLDERTYSAFLVVLRARRGLLHAELHVRPMPGEERLAPPADDILVGFAELVAQGLAISVIAPKHGWARYIQDPEAVGDADYDVFRSHKTRPYFFSPF
ncbi:hypothetical protein C8R44DRAFT_856198 [Mycena epipterygia]|nr:hypothetical protein C8R44DRAFT_856198 [Mycena epipterygia]